MAVGITTEANRPALSVSGTSKFRTSVKRIPPRPCSEPSKKRGSWKIWGSTTSTLDMRADPQNLPPGMVASAWPGAGYASFGGGDVSTAYQERGEIYDFIQKHGITGFATIAGDRHSF